MHSTTALTRPLVPRLVAVALVLVLGLAACGDDDGGGDVTAGDGTTTSAPASDQAGDGYGGGGAAGGDDTTSSATVVAEDFSLTSITVPAGSDVKVENQGSAPHTVTADEGGFDSGTVDGGSSGSFTAPAEAGDYAFHCEIHPDMTGTLTVEA